MRKKVTAKNGGAGCRGTPGPGRPKGSRNKVPQELREIVSEFVARNMARAQELFDRAARRSPATALKLLTEMTDYVLPRLQRAELQVKAACNTEPPPVSAADVLAAFHAAPRLPAPQPAPAVIPPPLVHREPAPALAAPAPPPAVERETRLRLNTEEVLDTVQAEDGTFAVPPRLPPPGGETTYPWQVIPEGVKEISPAELERVKQQLRRMK
jgi:hypothetical protein